MVVELAAVRLLAPWFGTSLVVWTNVIAVILLALAVGYLLGGRLAGAERPGSILARVLLGAGLLVAWLPFLGAWLSRSLLPERIALDEAAQLVGWGSLAVSLVVFLPPALLLGMVSPLVVEVLARIRAVSAGRAGGLVLFVSTLGSLGGVFGTSHVLLPTLGLRWTFLLACTLLLACALVAAVSAGERALGGGSGAFGAIVLGAALWARPGAARLEEGKLELERRESTYQSLRVVEDRGQGSPLRYLQVNEGFDSFQSLWQPDPGLLPEGYYFNDFLLPTSWDGEQPEWRVLVLGLGAGTVVRVFAALDSPRPEFVGVELDPAVVELGRRYFELGSGEPGLEIRSGLDGRVALRAAEGTFDQIVLDCYANQVEIPPHMCTIEFFAEACARLREGGWLTANLGGFGFEDPVVSAVAASCARGFASAVLLVRVPMSRNFVLLARRGAPLPWGPEGLSAATHASPLALGPRLLPGFVQRVEPEEGTSALTDDRCPIEKLQQDSIAEARRLRLGSSGS